MPEIESEEDSMQSLQAGMYESPLAQVVRIVSRPQNAISSLSE